jgi:hypothetical protein
MKTDLSPEPNPVSEARLKANRANAKLSTGPHDTARTRFNACKHGLSALMVLPGQDTPENRESCRRAWVGLGPRNPLEERCVRNLLQTRLREDFFLEVERTVLTRKPVGTPSNREQLYPFLHDATALKTLEQMARHQAHLTRTFDKILLELLRVRKETWGALGDSASNDPRVGELSTTGADTEAAVMPECQLCSGLPHLSPATLEYCLANKRLILPGEDEQLYEGLARRLWATFRPANTLE